jgi:hypothetical protein
LNSHSVCLWINFNNLQGILKLWWVIYCRLHKVWLPKISRFFNGTISLD